MWSFHRNDDEKRFRNEHSGRINTALPVFHRGTHPLNWEKGCTSRRQRWRRNEPERSAQRCFWQSLFSPEHCSAPGCRESECRRPPEHLCPRKTNGWKWAIASSQTYWRRVKGAKNHLVRVFCLNLPRKFVGLTISRWKGKPPHKNSCSWQQFICKRLNSFSSSEGICSYFGVLQLELLFINGTGFRLGLKFGYVWVIQPH